MSLQEAAGREVFRNVAAAYGHGIGRCDDHRRKFCQEGAINDRAPSRGGSASVYVGWPRSMTGHREAIMRKASSARARDAGADFASDLRKWSPLPGAGGISAFCRAQSQS
jgi:hypothetical protein